MHTASMAAAPPRAPSNPPRHRPGWPSERLALLRALYDEDLSHQAIADRLGVGKGVVSAKIARLNWRRREQQRAGPAAAVVPPMLDTSRFKRLEALGVQDCHWPTVEDAQGVQLFCACRREPGAIYCESHQARARRRPRAWEQRILEPARKPSPKAGLGWDRFGDR